MTDGRLPKVGDEVEVQKKGHGGWIRATVTYVGASGFLADEYPYSFKSRNWRWPS